MIGEAIYVGLRTYKRKEKVNEQTGEIIPEFNGVQMLFYSSDWNNEFILDMGKTRFYTVDMKEFEEKLKHDLPKIGTMCRIQVNENFGQNASNYCKYVGVKE